MKRNSLDKTHNREGTLLADFCRSYSLVTANGRCNGDEVGNFTFIGTMGNSVIDYFISSMYIIDKIMKFCVGNRDETSHFPLELTFRTGDKGDRQLNVHSYDNKSDNTLKKTFHFTKPYVSSLIASVTERLNNASLHVLLERIEHVDIDINVITQELHELFKDCLQCCESERVFTKQPQPPWFDKECLSLKREKLTLLTA